jgi:hypothetical protein
LGAAMRDTVFGQGAYEETPAVEGLGGVSGGFSAEGVGGCVRSRIKYDSNV